MNTPRPIDSPAPLGRHGLPSSFIRPVASGQRPKIAPARLDFPAPTGPVTATTSPPCATKSNGVESVLSFAPEILRTTLPHSGARAPLDRPTPRPIIA